MKIRTLLGIGAVLCACVVVRSDDATGVKLVGKPGDVSNYIKGDVADLQKALKADKPEKKSIKQAKVLAVVIGLNADAAGGDSVAAREHAAKVLSALADEQWAAAKTAAAALSNPGKPKGDKPVDLVKFLYDADPAVKDWDRDLTMQLFKTPRAGGLGIESKIKNWAEEGIQPKDFALAASYAQKSAVIGQALQKMTHPKGKKITADQWSKFSADMAKSAEDALTAAGKKDAKGIQAAMGRLDKACTVCHELAK